MSAYKIVQELPFISLTSGGIATSTPISLKTGYIRIIPEANAYVKLSNSTGINTTTGFWIPANNEVVLKETVRCQPIVGIVTGTSTVVSIPEGTTSAFEAGDYVELTGITPSGINTSYTQVSSVEKSAGYNSSYNTKITLSWNTASQGPVTVPTGEIRKVTKLTAFNDSGSTNKIHLTEVQVVSNFS
jgi:hypothetical protein